MYSFIATAVPRNKTVIYATISAGLATITGVAAVNVWRNWTTVDPAINPCHLLIVANNHSEDIIHTISNLCFVIAGRKLNIGRWSICFSSDSGSSQEGDTMFEKNSCCTYCGARFPLHEPWPIICRSCSNTNYLNPLPVVVLLVPVENGLVVARRNIEPQRGTLVLPGGYLDLGETWQEGAAREFFEETGIRIAAGEISLYDVANGLDNTLVIGGLAAKQPLSCLHPFSSDETQEIALIEEPVALGFPLHDLWVRRYFAEAGRS